MCIICNCDELGDEFLNEFRQSIGHLKNAESALLKCSKKVKSYDAKHKQLVRMRKELNKWFTEERENHK